MDELWGVFCEDLVENWQRYNGTAQYFGIQGTAVNYMEPNNIHMQDLMDILHIKTTQVNLEIG